MSEVTRSYEGYYGCQAMDKFRKCGIELSRYEKDLGIVLSLKSKESTWKWQLLKT